MTVTTDPWQVWVNGVTHTSTSATADVIWQTWATNSTASATRVFTRPQVVETAAERAAREERMRVYQREQAAAAVVERRIAAEASQRAEQLLLAVLSEPQREQYKSHRWIIVTGRSGRLYRVRRGRVGNVDVLRKDGLVLDRLCAHPNVWTPDEDVMLAQLLHLQHDDDEFCRSANRHSVLATERVPGVH